MKNVIVSGAAGFIGSKVVELLTNQKCNVYAIVPESGMTQFEKKRICKFNVPIIECNLQNIRSLSEKIKGLEFDTFFQFAWDGLSKEKLANYNFQIDNIKWILDSVEAASELKCKKVIGAGTITQREIHYPRKQSNGDKHQYYRYAQQYCDQLGGIIAKDKQMEFIWPLITNVYGEGEVSSRFVCTMLNRLLKGEKQPVSAGEQIYDFVHISDAAKAFIAIGERGIENRNYVIGSGEAKPLKKFLEIIEEVLEQKLGWNELEYNGIYLEKDVYSIANLQQDTGYEPIMGFKEGIENTVKWMVDHE